MLPDPELRFEMWIGPTGYDSGRSSSAFCRLVCEISDRLGDLAAGNPSARSIHSKSESEEL